MVDLVGVIRAKLGEVAEFSYSDGCVLFHGDICNHEESAKLDDCGMLDALARVLAESLKDNIDEIVQDGINEYLRSQDLDQ